VVLLSEWSVRKLLFGPIVLSKVSRCLVVAALLVLGACATSPATSPGMADMDVVARDSQFALVRLKAGQGFEDVAQVFLGSPHELWQLHEVNADRSASPGQVVAVPLTPTNSSSVYPDGYRTLPILCYHQFTHDATGAHRLELTAEAFELQIRYLLGNGYQSLSFADVDDMLRGGRPIPPRGVVLTIDDGYRSVYDVAWPILKKYQVKATLFIYTDFIGTGKALSWAQMQEMTSSGLIDIQSHGKSHASLSRLPEDKTSASYKVRVLQEISASNAVFKRHRGETPVYLSYPYGNSSVTAAELLAKQGYSLAATVTRGENTVYSDPYLLYRTMIYDDHDIDEFARMVRSYRRKPLQ
jgi:peptidoglycan/xylan/chitin deacetylase (PgdA/CDA1 family)